ncbi:MAG: hypothetical protein KIT58_02285 [Planctomycetota bacterium]|nr:hypothetical protein [Planctomycetota bacterium]
MASDKAEPLQRRSAAPPPRLLGMPDAPAPVLVREPGGAPPVPAPQLTPATDEASPP